MRQNAKRERIPDVLEVEEFQRLQGELRLRERIFFATTRLEPAGKRGRQPLWLCKVLSYHIQPIAKKQGITKRIGWHTFRRTYTTLLRANGEDVKVVQELLRHGSARITMDVYAQAVTPAKPMARGKVVAMLRDGKKDEQTE